MNTSKTVKPADQWLLEAEKALPLDPKLTKEIIFSIQQDAFGCGAQHSEHEWMRGHYHCRKCGAAMECWKSFPFRADVCRLGGCISCGIVFLESDKAAPKWLDIPV